MQALASIAQLTMLTELRIACCNKITSNGTPHLSTLARLRVLAVQGCVRVGDRALLPLLPRLPRLDSLSVDGCLRVGATVQSLCSTISSHHF